MVIGLTTQYRGNTVLKAGILAYVDEFLAGLTKVRVIRVFKLGPDTYVTYRRIHPSNCDGISVMGTSGAYDVIPCGCVRLRNGFYRLNNPSAVVLG